MREDLCSIRRVRLTSLGPGASERSRLNLNAMREGENLVQIRRVRLTSLYHPPNKGLLHPLDEQMWQSFCVGGDGGRAGPVGDYNEGAPAGPARIYGRAAVRRSAELD